VLKKVLRELFPTLSQPGLVTVEAMQAKLASDDTIKESLASWARAGFLSEHIVRPGDHDGDISYAGFNETSFLDLVSHGLKRSPADAPPSVGDFEPSHRIAIYDESPSKKMDIVDLISQSDVLRALLADKASLGAVVQRSVHELFGEKDVLTVPHDLVTIGAFALLHNNDISGVGVTDSSGRLVAHLTVADLCCLKNAEDFDLLALPALEFARLREALPSAPPTPGAGAGPGSATPPVVTARPDETLLTLMASLVEGKAHRAYVVDEQGRPIGVVTLTDVLRLFAVDPSSDKDLWLTW